MLSPSWTRLLAHLSLSDNMDLILNIIKALLKEGESTKQWSYITLIFCYFNPPGMSGHGSGTTLGFENLFFNTLLLTNVACFKVKAMFVTSSSNRILRTTTKHIFYTRLSDWITVAVVKMTTTIRWASTAGDYNFHTDDATNASAADFECNWVF